MGTPTLRDHFICDLHKNESFRRKGSSLASAIPGALLGMVRHDPTGVGPGSYPGDQQHHILPLYAAVIIGLCDLGLRGRCGRGCAECDLPGVGPGDWGSETRKTSLVCIWGCVS